MCIIMLLLCLLTLSLIHAPRCPHRSHFSPQSFLSKISVATCMSKPATSHAKFIRNVTKGKNCTELHREACKLSYDPSLWPLKLTLTHVHFHINCPVRTLINLHWQNVFFISDRSRRMNLASLFFTLQVFIHAH